MHDSKLPSAARLTDAADNSWDVVLLCTEPHSLMQQYNPFPDRCRVHDVTKEMDITREQTFQEILQLLRTQRNVAVLASLPCTGGCTFNTGTNAARPSCAPKLRAHQLLFTKLWRQLERLVRELGSIPNLILEWPRSCQYWAMKQVGRLVRRTGCEFCDFDGCAYGLQSIAPKTRGMAIKKPWRFATNIPAVKQLFQRRCDGTHTHARNGNGCGRRNHNHQRCWRVWRAAAYMVQSVWHDVVAD